MTKPDLQSDNHFGLGGMVDDDDDDDDGSSAILIQFFQL